MIYHDYKVQHSSDCSVYNRPAYPQGPCNCKFGIVGLTVCPFCGESKLAIAEKFEPDLPHNPHITSRRTFCQECENEWWQIFNFTDYEEFLRRKDETI